MVVPLRPMLKDPVSITTELTVPRLKPVAHHVS
jgi:hypothetical protein